MQPNLTPSRPERRRSGVRLLTAATVIGLLAVSGAPALAAAPVSSPASVTSGPVATATDGWIRVAHLSPDTAKVTVNLTALGGGAAIFTLDNVGYGAVSDYVHIPAGTYVVAMVPAGSAVGAKPIISASVTIKQGKSITVAAFGNNRDLQTRVFEDDLTGPQAGAARIRLIQASTVTDEVSVRTTTGLLVAQQAKAGDSTTYASVPAGSWTLQLTGGGIDNTVQVTLPNGSVNTLFVLDNSTGGLTVKPILDSASVGAAPVGGVQTGGGANAAGQVAGATHPTQLTDVLDR